MVVSVDSFAQVVEAMSKLLGTVLWPIVAIVVVTRLLPDIWRVLDRGGFNFKAPGVELSVEKASEAAAALGAAAQDKGEDAPSPKDISAAISGVSQTRQARRLETVQVLWVDDHPENSEY